MESLSRRLILVFLLPFLLVLTSTAVFAAEEQTYYDILEISQDATLTDIKKSYRRLAVKHHPDRNRGNEEEATIKFREVSEAYEVLSDENQRRRYDQSLRWGAGGERQHEFRARHHRQRRDAFAQFDSLFRNDPFFQEAFKNMDDAFAKHFQQGGKIATATRSNTGEQQRRKQSWGEWVADKLGANIQVTTSSTTSTGGRRSFSSSSYGHGGGSYTSRNTRTVYENGQRVTIQSLEKDGNRIEEKYVGDTLVQRLINGVPEESDGRIAGDDL